MIGTTADAGARRGPDDHHSRRTRTYGRAGKLGPPGTHADDHGQLRPPGWPGRPLTTASSNPRTSFGPSRSDALRICVPFSGLRYSFDNFADFRDWTVGGTTSQGPQRFSREKYSCVAPNKSAGYRPDNDTVAFGMSSVDHAGSL